MEFGKRTGSALFKAYFMGELMCGLKFLPQKADGNPCWGVNPCCGNFVPAQKEEQGKVCAHRSLPLSYCHRSCHAECRAFRLLRHVRELTPFNNAGPG